MLPQQPGQSEQVWKWINTHTPEPHLPLLSTAPRRRHTQEVLIQLASKAIERVFEPTTYFVACLHAPFPLVYWTCVPLFHVVGNAVTRSINSGTIFRNAKKIKKIKKNSLFRAIFHFCGYFTCKIVQVKRVFCGLGRNKWVNQYAAWFSIRYIMIHFIHKSLLSYTYIYTYAYVYAYEQPSALIKTSACQFSISDSDLSNWTCCKN